MTQTASTRWKIRTGDRDDLFHLDIQVESEVRPNRTLVWEGRIKVTGNGYAQVERMHLAGIDGEGSGEGEKPEREKVLRDLILDNTTNSGSVGELIGKVANACRRDSQRLEKILLEKEEKASREKSRRESVTMELRELAAMGTQKAPPGGR